MKPVQYTHNLLTAFQITGAVNAQQTVIPTTHFVNYATYATLYTQFRLMKVKWIFECITVETTDNAQVQRILLSAVHDSSAIPTTALMQRRDRVWDVMFSEDNRRFEFTTIPFCVREIYGGVTPTYAREYRKWNEMLAGNDTVYYGMDYATVNVTAGMIINVDMEVTVQYRGQI